MSERKSEEEERTRGLRERERERERERRGEHGGKRDHRESSLVSGAGANASYGMAKSSARRGCS